MIGEPPTLDGHTTTAVITREIAVNMFEGLYALDAKYQPVPLLAEGQDVLDGGKRYAIRLRKDVKFHNGKAADLGRRRRLAQALGHPGRHRQGRLQGRRGGRGQGPATRSRSG